MEILFLVWFVVPSVLLCRWLRTPLRQSTLPRAMQYGILDIYVIVIQLSLLGALFASTPSLMDWQMVPVGVMLAGLLVFLWSVGVKDLSAHPLAATGPRLMWLSVGVQMICVSPFLAVAFATLFVIRLSHEDAFMMFVLCGLSAGGCAAGWAMADSIAWRGRARE